MPGGQCGFPFRGGGGCFMSVYFLGGGKIGLFRTGDFALFLFGLLHLKRRAGGERGGEENLKSFPPPPLRAFFFHANLGSPYFPIS